jgi:hypothetical integral membrane protein (TIGR02206 family)
MKPFILYGSIHGMACIIACLLIIGVYRYAGLVHTPQQRRRSSRLFLGIMASIYALLTAAKIAANAWTWQGNLPLHLCDISAWTMIYALFSKRKWAFEAGYYWGLTGGVLAFAVPNVSTLDAYLIPFFGWHALLVAIPLYQIRTDALAPTHIGIYRTMAITIALALPVMYLNSLLRSNYMFLNEKIAPMSLLGFPEHPYYLFLLIPIGLALWYLWWLIALGCQRLRRRKNAHTH